MAKAYYIRRGEARPAEIISVDERREAQNLRFITWFELRKI